MAQTKSVIFTPMPDRAVNDVLTLGAMIDDAALLRTKLRRLPHTQDGFRGELRIIQTAAQRIHKAAAMLLGEEVTA